MHRDDFPKELMDNVIYLDNGATTFKPKWMNIILNIVQMPIEEITA